MISLQTTRNYVFPWNFANWTFWDTRSTSPFTIKIVTTTLLLHNHNRSFQACVYKEPSGRAHIYWHNSCNIGTCGLPDMYTLLPLGLQPLGNGCTYQADHLCPCYNYKIYIYTYLRWVFIIYSPWQVYIYLPKGHMTIFVMTVWANSPMLVHSTHSSITNHPDITQTNILCPCTR